CIWRAIMNDPDSPGIGDPSPGGDPLGTDPSQPGAGSQMGGEVDPGVGIGQPPEMSFTTQDALQVPGLTAIPFATFASASPAVAALGTLGAAMMSADPLGTALGHAAQDLSNVAASQAPGTLEAGLFGSGSVGFSGLDNSDGIGIPQPWTPYPQDGTG